MRCAAHPRVETNLRCGKCGKPICPRCLVQSPVGARCPDCARLHRLPTYRVTARYYLRAALTASGMAVICGVGWWIIGIFLHFLFLGLLLAAGVGFAIGEVVGLSVNRKRGAGLAIIAGAGVALSYLVSILLPGGSPFGLINILLDLLALALGIFVAVTRLR
ncbi:B-box zinc finger protein, partial [Chloroflexota bacterium]